jgi:hypothetical protein
VVTVAIAIIVAEGVVIVVVAGVIVANKVKRALRMRQLKRQVRQVNTRLDGKRIAEVTRHAGYDIAVTNKLCEQAAEMAPDRADTYRLIAQMAAIELADIIRHGPVGKVAS